MIRSFLLISFSLLLLASTIGPSVALCAQLKMEFLDLHDQTEEDTSVLEMDCFEKEIVLHRSEYFGLFFTDVVMVSNEISHKTSGNHSADIFLPPPEIL